MKLGVVRVAILVVVTVGGCVTAQAQEGEATSPDLLEEDPEGEEWIGTSDEQLVTELIGELATPPLVSGDEDADALGTDGSLAASPNGEATTFTASGAVPVSGVPVKLDRKEAVRRGERAETPAAARARTRS